MKVNTDQPPNGSPAAVDDMAASVSDVEQIIAVLANESDGDTLAVDSVVGPTVGGGTDLINPYPTP